MKNLLLLFLCISPIIVQAEEEFFDRDLASYNSSNPNTGEAVTCYPQTQVQKWKKRKKPEPITVEKIVEKEVNITKPNNISFIAERSFVNLDLDPNTTVASTEPSVRPGLMYQRDVLDWLRLSIGVTTKGALLGAGYNF